MLMASRRKPSSASYRRSFVVIFTRAHIVHNNRDATIARRVLYAGKLHKFPTRKTSKQHRGVDLEMQQGVGVDESDFLAPTRDKLDMALGSDDVAANEFHRRKNCSTRRLQRRLAPRLRPLTKQMSLSQILEVQYTKELS